MDALRAMGGQSWRSTGEPACSFDQLVEKWPFVEHVLLLPSCSRRVCMTCHFFRHHNGVNSIPPLLCQLHRGLIAHGEHLTHRCHGWTGDPARRSGWAPEAA